MIPERPENFVFLEIEKMSLTILASDQRKGDDSAEAKAVMDELNSWSVSNGRPEKSVEASFPSLDPVMSLSPNESVMALGAVSELGLPIRKLPSGMGFKTRERFSIFLSLSAFIPVEFPSTPKTGARANRNPRSELVTVGAFAPRYAERHLEWGTSKFPPGGPAILLPEKRIDRAGLAVAHEAGLVALDGIKTPFPNVSVHVV